MIITAETKQNIEQSVKKILHDIGKCTQLRMIIVSNPEDATTISCAFEKIVEKEPENAKNEENRKNLQSPKKEWTEKQKKDIQMIKDAHKAKRAEKKTEVKLETIGNKKDGRRKDIDNSLIVYMIDEQGKKFKDVAKELNCCEQTVRNRYEQEKKNAKK